MVVASWRTKPWLSQCRLLARTKMACDLYRARGEVASQAIVRYATPRATSVAARTNSYRMRSGGANL